MLRPLAIASCVVVAAHVVAFAQSSAPAGAGTKPAEIRGVLLEQAGTPAVKHQVAVRNDAGDLFTSGPTGVDGAFVIAGLPAGNYRLAAFAPDGTEFPVAGKPFTLADGQVERLEIRIAGPGTAPGRAAPPPAETQSGFGRFLASSGGKVAIVVAGIAAVGLALGGSDDDDAPAPVSPSAPAR